MGIFSVLFTSWTVAQVEREERANVMDAQKALVHATVGDLDEKIELRRDAMRTIAALYPSNGPVSPAAIEAFFEPRPVLRKVFDAVSIVDAQGRAQYVWPQDAPFPDDRVAERPYFRSVLNGASSVISDPSRGAAGGEPFIVFAAPLKDRSGHPNGALLGALYLNHPNFLGNLAKVKIGDDGYLSLLSLSDPPVFIMDPHPERVAAPAPGGSDHPLVIAARQGQEGAVEGLNTFGVDTVRTFLRLKTVPWMLISIYPTAEAFAGLRARKSEAIWIGAGLFVLSATAAWLMTLWLMRPLTRLQMRIEADLPESPEIIADGRYGSAELAAVSRAYQRQFRRREEVEARLRNSEERLQRITDSVPALIAHLDTDMRYTFANEEYRRVFGIDPSSMLGRTGREVRGERIHNDVGPWTARALAGERVRFERSERVGGTLRHFRSEHVPDVDSTGKVVGVYVLSLDITATKLAQEVQARTEERLRAITDNLPVLISYVDRDERVQFLNATFFQWYGISADAAKGQSLAESLGPNYASQYRDKILQCLSGERVDFEIESRTRLGPKALQVVYIPDVRADGSVAGLYSLSTDVTDLKRAQRQLDSLVRSDTLTGLPNRFRFNEALPLAMVRAQASGLGLALMFLDIDHFKAINDRFGHAGGDSVLKEFSRRLSRTVRATDLVARLAGDEFVIVLEGLHNEREAGAVAAKVLSEIRQPFLSVGELLRVTTSIGVVFDPVPVATPSELLARADTALYQAKAAGRDCFKVHVPPADGSTPAANPGAPAPRAAGEPGKAQVVSN